MPTDKPFARFHADERGAILVLGVFMCACMVGMLWYLAGIGDAIIYRERMQEGSDAVAFSAAVLHARGMNLIVLLNLIMAVILAVRVAMRAVQAALFIVGAILAVIPGAQALSSAAFAAGRAMEVPIKTTRPIINNTIKALSKVQVGIARVVPPAAIVGSYQVGARYKPIVENSAAGSPVAIRDGLPVQEDSEDKLCGKAGEAVANVLSWAAPIPAALANRVSGLIGKLVKKGGAYFCEIGSGGGPPDFGDELGSSAEEACDKEKEQLDAAVTAADRQYQEACTRYGCDRGATLTAAEQSELDRLSAQRDAAQQKSTAFDRDKCVEEKKKNATDKFNQEMGAVGTPRSANGQGLTPKKVKTNWKNGTNDAQVVSIATGNQNSLRSAPKGVKAGAWRTQVTIDVPATSRFALAQAEFFYDCRGAWTSRECNGPANDGEAMWHFRWRARLRRYNAPFGNNTRGLEDATEIMAGAETFSQLLRNIPTVNSLTIKNAALIAQLGDALKDRELIIH